MEIRQMLSKVNGVLDRMSGGGPPKPWQGPVPVESEMELRLDLELNPKVDIGLLIKQVPKSGVRHVWIVRKGASIYPFEREHRGETQHGPLLGTIDLDELDPEEERPELRGVKVGLARFAVDGRGKRQTLRSEVVFGRGYRYRPAAPWD